MNADLPSMHSAPKLIYLSIGPDGLCRRNRMAPGGVPAYAIAALSGDPGIIV